MADTHRGPGPRTGEIHRETVVLRRLRASDSEAVHAAFASADDMARQGDVTTPAEAERYVARLLAADSPHEPWAIAEDDELIGLIALTVDEENLSGWFWYWMTHRARGRGLTGRAAATVAEWALTERGLERLELGHRVNNPASGAVARAAGFIQEGTERGKFLLDGQRIDVHTCGRLRTDPSPVFDALPLLDRDGSQPSSGGSGGDPVEPGRRGLEGEDDATYPGSHGIGGIVMSAPHQKPVHDHAPGPGEETPLPDLEDDETIAPRPEEEIADLFREGPVAKGPGDAGE